MAVIPPAHAIECDLVVPFSPTIVVAAFTDLVLLDGWLGSVTEAGDSPHRFEVRWSSGGSEATPSDIPVRPGPYGPVSAVELTVPASDSAGSAATGLATTTLDLVFSDDNTVVRFTLEELGGGPRGTSTRVGVAHVSNRPLLNPTELWTFWLRRLAILDELLRGRPAQW